VNTDICSTPELRQLVAAYAYQVRRLSEALATMGGELAARRDYHRSFAEVKKLRALSEQAGCDLFVVIETSPVRGENG
jgi:hypothetical protein